MASRQVGSFVSPKIAVRASEIHGRGMFATLPIPRGEIVFIKGGHVLTRREVFTSDVIESYLPIDDDFFIGASDAEEEARVKLYVNHSCEPTCGVRGEITFVALRDIASGEELTCDYAMVDNEDYHFVCNCRSPPCRGVISGFDWRLASLQEKYGEFFARYLRDKMPRRITPA